MIPLKFELQMNFYAVQGRKIGINPHLKTGLLYIYKKENSKQISASNFGKSANNLKNFVF